MGLLFLCFWFSLMLKTQKQKHMYPRVGLTPLKTMFCWFSRGFLFVFFGFLWYVWFSRRLFVCSKNIRENRNKQKQQKTHKTKKQTIQGWVWNLEQLCCFLFCVFPNDVVVFFGCLWYFRFSQMFVLFCKSPRENPKQQTRPNPYPRVGLKPLKTLFFCCFP